MEQSSDNRNMAGSDQAAALVEEAYATMSLVFPAEGEDGQETRYPRSRAEVRRLREIASRLESVECGDPEVATQCEQIKAIVAENTTRSFNGSMKLLIFSCVCAVAISIFMYNMKVRKKYTPDMAEGALKASIASTDARVERLEKLLVDSAATFSAKQKKATQKRLDESSKEQKALSEMSVNAYMKRHNARRLKDMMGMLPTLILMALYPVLYYMSSRSHRYVVMRRLRMIRAWRTSGNVIGRAVTGIIGSIMSIPTTTTVTRYSDGTTTKEDDGLEVMAMQFMLIVVVAALVLIAFVYIMPLIILANFVLNYGEAGLEKYNARRAAAQAAAKA